ncbi:MAG: PAS domain-containing protein [Bacteroidetes bacterium]|nr:PAS domain-containing protein [Bacteroidota bacterium]
MKGLSSLDSQLFSVAVEHFKDAILIIRKPESAGVEPVIEYANARVEQLTGYSPEELVGKSPKILNSEESDHERLDEIYKAMLNDESFCAEMKNYHRDGSPYWVEITLTPLRTQNASFTHYMSVNRDITRQRNVQNTMLLHASVLDQIQNGVVVLDKNQKVMYWNDAAERLYQYTAKEMMGNKAGKLTYHEDSHIANAAVKAMIETGQWEGEIRLERKDGTCFPALVSNRKLLGDDEEVIGYIGVSTDISYLKKIQDELEESLSEKEVLLKEIHHRVKNNMQVISSLLFLQSMQTDDKLIQDILIESQNRVRSMSMVHEKLYRSTNLSRIAFDDYIIELTGDQMNTWLGKDSVVQKHFDVDYVEIDIDKAIPCGLLVNELISNAVKHGLKHQPSGNLWLSLHKNDGKVRITVGNDGNKLPEGFTLEHTDTLGMQLIDSLTRQLDGTLKYSRDPHTLFELEFTG